MNSIDHLRYAPCSSSLRCSVLLEDIVASVMWNSERSLHALDHQEYLDLEAMVLCVMTAFWMMGLELSSTRYAMYLANRMTATTGLDVNLNSIRDLSDKRRGVSVNLAFSNVIDDGTKDALYLSVLHLIGRCLLYCLIP